MLTRLAHFLVQKRKAVLVAAGLLLVISAVFGGSVSKKLNNGGFDDPSAPSTRAATILDHQFHTGDPNLVLVVKAKPGKNVDDPAVAAEGLELTRLASQQPNVNAAISYWSLGRVAPLRSTDHTEALVLARIAGNDDQTVQRVVPIAKLLSRHDANVDVTVTGQAQVFHQVGDTIKADLARAESIAIPITVLLLVVVFGSAVAAGLPLAVGALAVVGTFLALRVLVTFTHVSIYSLNLTTAMGLGLAIDYSLFVVSRFREELHHGRDTEAAVVRTVETAGRTVLFSAFAVAASLAALMVFPLYFLRSFAYAGVAVVAIAAGGALIVLPALLAVLGPNVDRLRVFHHQPKEVGEGFWHRLAMTVMRRPLPIATAIVVLLVLLGTPFLKVNFSLPDDRVLPKGATSRQGLADVRTKFTGNESSALSVVAPAAGNPAAASTAAKVNSYAVELSRLTGVARVDAYTGSFINGTQVAPASAFSQSRFGNAEGTWLSLVPAANIEPLSKAGEHLVSEIRHAPAPWPVLLTGSSARLVDSKAGIFAKVPLALGIIAVITFITLFMMFGSLLVPAKAVVLNLLSLSATFGAMVWIFQQGHGAGLLGFTPTGSLDTTTPILMFCIAFGLSMDYEVFLLSRIKEEHDKGSDNMTSVANGLERTGRIVTALALLLAIVFIANVSSSITFIKLFGLGLTMAVLVDATLIRGTLVPAFMRLAGNANWWAPGPLRRLHERYGFSESEPAEAEPAEAEPAEAEPPATAPAAAAVARPTIDLTGSYSATYIRRMVETADACGTEADLDEFLALEGLTREQLNGWREDLGAGRT